jgi:hypothetical protein
MNKNDVITQVVNSLENCIKELKLIVEEKEAKPITLEQVRKVLAELSRDGFTEDVRTLLKKYGSDKLSGIKQEDYQALLEDARGIEHGNK